MKIQMYFDYCELPTAYCMAAPTGRPGGGGEGGHPPRGLGMGRWAACQRANTYSHSPLYIYIYQTFLCYFDGGGGHKITPPCMVNRGPPRRWTRAHRKATANLTQRAPRPRNTAKNKPTKNDEKVSLSGRTGTPISPCRACLPGTPGGHQTHRCVYIYIYIYVFYLYVYI